MLCVYIVMYFTSNGMLSVLFLNVVYIHAVEAYRKKVVNELSKKFSTPTEAKIFYFPPESENQSTRAIVHSSLTVEEVISRIHHLLEGLNSLQQLQIISTLFHHYAVNDKDLLVPNDFLQLSIDSMQNLKDGRRCNVLYKFAKATATMRDDGSDTLLPIKRLPMGLLEHCVNFFTATSIVQVCDTIYHACNCV